MALCISQIGFSQEKYAVLITGDYASLNVPLADQYNGGQGQNTYGYDDFWNDTFLMWEMLQDKGYDPDNIYVLFADGQDYSLVNQNIDDRYKPDQTVTVTDYSASIANLQTVFNGLRYGNNGFPAVGQDDYLFVWTFDHGGGSNGNSTLYLIDGIITDDDFAALVNPIPAHKKTFWMQQCRSGGFHDELEATNTVFHSACQPNQNAYRANNTPDLENEILGGDTYHHGEFNFHTYSSTNGASPTGSTSYYGVQYTAADLNSDNYISMYESWIWESIYEDSSETPLFSDLGSISAYTSLEYPTLLHTNMSTNETHRGLIGVSKDFEVQSGSELIFLKNSKVDFLNGAVLTVKSGATLTIGKFAEFTDGEIIIENGANINIDTDTYFNDSEIQLFNNTLYVNDIHMDNESKIWIKSAGNHQILNSNFSVDSQIRSIYKLGTVLIDNCTFDNSYIHLHNSDFTFIADATITNNSFIGSDIYTAIRIEGCDIFHIENNTIGNYIYGIEVWNSGFGKGNFNIFNNTITNVIDVALTFYASTGNIENNTITNNGDGVKLLNRSRVRLAGNPNANSNSETQLIKDNVSEEVYMSTYSIPNYFHYNVIIDEDNAGGEPDPLVYHNPPPFGQTIKDVKNNCWGNNFNAAVDLYPYPGYNYNPIWCPGGGMAGSSAAEDLYNTSRSQFEAENYSASKTSLENLITTYPDTKYAQAAIKDLYIVEIFVTGDYSTLKAYYANNAQIQSSEMLKSLADFFMNRCDIKLENWQDAIDYYEEKINGEPDSEESVFAIIDLGLLYYIMENSDSKAPKGIGKILEHKPKSQKQFNEKRSYLLSLLPFKSKSKEKPQLNSFDGVLGQNIPNPFSENTKIEVKLTQQSHFTLAIKNINGKMVREIQFNEEAGLHQIDVNMKDLPSGVYYYSLYIDNKYVNTKKMLIVK